MPAPNATVGLLEQEPHLDETKDVKGNVEEAVAETKALLARVNELANWKPKPLIEARAARRNTRAGKPAAIYILAGLRRANPDKDKADEGPKG